MTKKTVERWISEIFPNSHTIKQADMADKKRDRSIKRRIQHNLERTRKKTPETDWRVLNKKVDK